MIKPPRRSVTRFFIPMIDVWTLLFCIFLLMPYVKPVEGEEPPVPEAKAADPKDPAEMQKELDRLRRERDRFARERDQAVRTQIVCVLEIDRDTGELFQRDF